MRGNLLSIVVMTVALVGCSIAAVATTAVSKQEKSMRAESVYKGMIDEKGIVQEDQLEAYYELAEKQKEISRKIESILNRLKPEAPASPAESQGVEEIPLGPAELTDEEKLEKLEEIRNRPYYGWFVWPREEAVLKGLIDEDAPRMTLEEVEALIKAAKKGNTVYTAVQEFYQYPDYASGPAFNGSPMFSYTLEGGERVIFTAKGSGWIIRLETPESAEGGDIVFRD